MCLVPEFSFTVRDRATVRPLPVSRSHHPALSAAPPRRPAARAGMAAGESSRRLAAAETFAVTVAIEEAAVVTFQFSVDAGRSLDFSVSHTLHKKGKDGKVWLHTNVMRIASFAATFLKLARLSGSSLFLRLCVVFGAFSMDFYEHL
eukprot:570450-Pleurochrysis_carterae.AAC.2